MDGVTFRVVKLKWDGVAEAIRSSSGQPRPEELSGDAGYRNDDTDPEDRKLMFMRRLCMDNRAPKLELTSGRPGF